ncbi:MAG: hypothetical protein ACI4WV_04110 [Eubacteriales bacterium]
MQKASGISTSVLAKMKK